MHASRRALSGRTVIAGALLAAAACDPAAPPPVIDSALPRQSSITWKLEYELREVDYEDSPLFRFQQARGELGYRLTRALRIFVGGGEETDFDQDPFATGFGASFYDVGFEWLPNEHLSLSVSAADRYYGTTGNIDLRYQFRSGYTSLTYYERPSNRSTSFRYRDPNRDLGGIDGLLDSGGRRDRFINETAQWLISLEGRRNTITLRLRQQKNQRRVDADGTSLEDEEELGARLSWNYIVNRRLATAVSVDAIRLETGSNKDERDVINLNIGLTYRLSPRADIRLSLTHTNVDSNTARLSSYTQNLVRIDFGFSI